MMINNILIELSKTKIFQQYELIPGNIILSHGIIDELIYEVRFVYTKNIFCQHLIDDYWSEEYLWNDYKIENGQKHILYICHPDIQLECKSIVIENELSLSTKFSVIYKYFINLTDELQTKLPPELKELKEYTLKTIEHSNTSPLPTFSIITSVFNNSIQLEQAIQSVINQNYKEFEYIIKDAGSTDNFKEIVQKYKSYIQQIISRPDNGVYYGMHEGIICSKGQYVACLNSDDIYASPKILEKISNALQENVSDAYFGDILIKQKEKTIYRKGDLKRLNIEMSVYHPSLFIAKKAYMDVGGFDFSYRIAADLDLVFRLLKNNCSFYHINEVFSVFRTGGLSGVNFNTLKEELRARWQYDKLNIIGFLYVIFRTLKHKIKQK